MEIGNVNSVRQVVDKELSAPVEAAVEVEVKETVTAG